MTPSLRIHWGFALLLALSPVAGPVRALDIFGVQNAALDQPQVNALLRLTDPVLSGPLTGDFFGDPVFNIRAFLDTGASGVILSEETAGFLGVPNSPGVLFNDVGIGGTAQFQVSARLRVDVAPFTPFVDINNPLTADTVYDQRFGPLRAQIGPLGAPIGLLGGTDVLGMPTMAGKVVVMDPKPLDTLSGNMQTYIYNPGTPYNDATADSNPGIPTTTNRSVAMTYASFDRFTSVTPPGAEGPTLHPNPFIGPNPLAAPGPGTTAGEAPGVTLTLGTRQTTGSFLLDTGAVASAISSAQAANLGVRVRPSTDPLAPPVLEFFDPANPGVPGTGQLVPDQFVVPLGGIGGEEAAAGFFLDSLLVRTREGDAANDLDPAHLRFRHAPVLVLDVTLVDATTGEIVTLDGLFGMNFLVASTDLESFPLGDINPSAFRWIVFDQQNGLLLLDVAAIPEPGTWAMMFAGLALLAFVARRRVARA